MIGPFRCKATAKSWTMDDGRWTMDDLVLDNHKKVFSRQVYLDVFSD